MRQGDKERRLCFAAARNQARVRSGSGCALTALFVDGKAAPLLHLVEVFPKLGVEGVLGCRHPLRVGSPRGRKLACRDFHLRPGTAFREPLPSDNHAREEGGGVSACVREKDRARGNDRDIDGGEEIHSRRRERECIINVCESILTSPQREAHGRASPHRG